MDPPVEDLLDKVDSKFTLVALSAKRARQINSYYNQLGEGLGFVVPPQVTSVSGKPLTIAFEEVAAGKATYHRLEPGEELEDGSADLEGAEVAEVVAEGPELTALTGDLDAATAGGRRVAGGSPRPRSAPGARTMTAGPATGKTIVLGVTGGIAAYKAVEVCRRLVDAGAHVVPVLTEDATRFVGAVTFSALASEPVQRTLWAEADPIPHTHLGRRADLVLVVPATARFLACYAHGIADGLLTATVLATRAPVMVCPAMHTEMWEHPAVQDNLATLRRRGVHVVEPGEGRLAGGDVGAGRLAEPADIVVAALSVLARPAAPRPTGSAAGAGIHGRDLAGRRVVVSAGGTASRSTRCDSSPTARRASRATPSPKRPRRAARTSSS